MREQTRQVHVRVREVTERIRERSRAGRADYLARMDFAGRRGSARAGLSCTNLAHGFAASGASDKEALKHMRWPNVAIVSAYNDMLSAHQPLERYPALIKAATRAAGAVAQFAGGVPAMCDGVTQGQPGMELSLFSRDVIAMATGVALAHNMFDSALCLGICDKIVPGMLMGALAFGHLPVIFVPGGPMPSGIPNKEKAHIRELYAEGKVGRDQLLESESGSYHSAGTCTFYGTANSNQMLMEVMGLHIPGSAFVPPNTALRDALTAAAAQRAARITALGPEYLPLARGVDEAAMVNAIVGLLATGGSTNHTLHLVAIARCAGIAITWDDFSDLSSVVPLLARIYPNGSADVNRFQMAGGMAFLVRELLEGGFLHGDIMTCMGKGLAAYAKEPWLDSGQLAWRAAPRASGDLDVLRPVAEPFSSHGGLRLLTGNLGRAVIKTSAMKHEHHVVEAPALVFDDQEEVIAAFKAGRLARDFVAVVRFQGPRANGMPELHQLTPSLASLQNKGFQVALVTDGRMSGASGSVPAAIHVSPECLSGGAIGKVRDGDLIRLDCHTGELEAKVAESIWRQREPPGLDHVRNEYGCGRELFATLRGAAGDAESGALSLM
ncbi:MAG TPA: phosphogluconate dehydratase [Steroidobacteraceae bacterium]|nr:phosphogluconate dehydratase [Steroidobacteraceae bacterium]